MKRLRICSTAYFYGEFYVVKKTGSDLWEAFARTGDAPRVATGYDTDEIDRKLRSLTPDPYVQ
jgi:hypothetical protein